MKAVLNTLVDELSRLKAAGVKTVSVSDEALTALRTALRKNISSGSESTHEPMVTEKILSQEPVPIVNRSAVLTVEERKPSPPSRKQESPTLPPPTHFELPKGDKKVQWDWLSEHVVNDPVCKSQTRTDKKVVLGVGSLDAKIMFVGEAPGAEEEIQGEPFVGPAGQLLTKMITATGLKRSDVYIGNIMNWRPKMPLGSDGIQRGNREPTEEEMGYCLPYLRAQIDIVQPEVLVGLGATAAKGLLGFGSFRTLGEIRGRWHNYQGHPLIITYHPSYLLRKESESKLAERKAKRMAWEDFMMMMDKAGMPISDKQRAFFL